MAESDDPVPDGKPPPPSAFEQEGAATAAAAAFDVEAGYQAADSSYIRRYVALSALTIRAGPGFDSEDEGRFTRGEILDVVDALQVPGKSHALAIRGRTERGWVTLKLNSNVKEALSVEPVKANAGPAPKRIKPKMDDEVYGASSAPTCIAALSVAMIVVKLLLLGIAIMTGGVFSVVGLSFFYVWIMLLMGSCGFITGAKVFVGPRGIVDGYTSQAKIFETWLCPCKSPPYRQTTTPWSEFVSARVVLSTDGNGRNMIEIKRKTRGALHWKSPDDGCICCASSGMPWLNLGDEKKWCKKINTMAQAHQLDEARMIDRLGGDEREQRVPHPISQAGAGTTFWCVKKATIRAGVSRRSQKIGVLEVGEQLTVLEETQLTSGARRVRIQPTPFIMGWVSMETQGGEVLLSSVAPFPVATTVSPFAGAATAAADAAADAASMPGCS
jgi:hypothetical protein